MHGLHGGFGGLIVIALIVAALFVFASHGDRNP